MAWHWHTQGGPISWLAIAPLWRQGRVGHAALRLLATCLIAGCGGAPAIFDAAGPAAREINRLWWLLFGLGTAVYIAVMGYLLLALYRRRPPMAEGNPRWGGNTRTVIWGGIVLPALILLIVYGFTVRTLWSLSARAAAAKVTIEVTGHHAVQRGFIQAAALPSIGQAQRKDVAAPDDLELLVEEKLSDNATQ